MRYKIAYALPWLPQKNVLNAHSHFAFAGWLSQILMVLMVRYLGKQDNAINLTKYNRLLIANLVTAWGMLLTFPWEGYGLLAIIFSTLSIFVSYAFAIVYWRDLNRLPASAVSHLWFKAALLWSAISSAGAYALALMMATGAQHERWYLAAIYFFLHFQYNGWFFFACAGLLYSGNATITREERYTFYLMALACLPAYLLSILWSHLPLPAYIITCLAAFMQIVGWGLMFHQLQKGRIRALQGISDTARFLFLFALIAGSIKFLLQAASLHPGLADLAYGFRPIVIAYLHLVLLGLLTMFIFAYLKSSGLIIPGAWRRNGIIVFVSGIVIQEVLLLIQGVMAMATRSVPFINEALLFAAIGMFCGLLMLNVGLRQQGRQTL
jgi:hypothetical protein